LAGGVACPHCGKARPEAWPVSKDTLRYFRHLQRSNWEQIEGIVIPERIESALADLIQRYISYILERQLNSPSFLKEIQRKDPDDGSNHPKS
jgi:DNA repair protein RecO (recombination protein O)